MKHFTIGIILVATLFSCSKEKQTNRAAEKMQNFVVNISNYARSYDADFIIIPQNGTELAFHNVEPNEGENPAYMLAVDGFGVEELFYDGNYSLDNERLAMLRQLKKTKKIMVSEYVTDNANVADALYRNYSEGFICFPRTKDNYHYSQIPDTIPYSNNADIIALTNAQNYLYLINTENFTSKEEMIHAIAATDFDLILIDLFFNDTELTTSEINQLKRKANGGQRVVISYINIGAAEKFRYYWKDEWERKPPIWLKKQYEGYDDEFLVQFWHKEWQQIIYGNKDSYMKKIINAGFDGAYLDNVETYYFLYHNE